mmetsp:Transcript_23936/g.54480  ORF Transcript_23936/g.54480 Transcript_23936/m.54480 type:complete len:84 (-) Transcript_23936:633-884(-)
MDDNKYFHISDTTQKKISPTTQPLHNIKMQRWGKITGLYFFLPPFFFDICKPAERRSSRSSTFFVFFFTTFVAVVAFSGALGS